MTVLVRRSSPGGAAKNMLCTSGFADDVTSGFHIMGLIKQLMEVILRYNVSVLYAIPDMAQTHRERQWQVYRCIHGRRKVGGDHIYISTGA